MIQFQSRSMSDPPISDIYFKIEVAWVWTTLTRTGIHRRPSHDDDVEEQTDAYRLRTVSHQYVRS